MLSTLTEVLSALADGTRLRIFHLLSSGPLCVGDLVSLLELPQPTVSRHLAVLRSRGLVEVRTADRWRIYSLGTAGDELSRAVHELVRAAAARDRDLQRDLERRVRLAEAGGCCPKLAPDAFAGTPEEAALR